MVDIGFRKKQSRARPRIGLDLGSHSIKIVQLSGGAEKPSLVSFGLKKILGSSPDAVSTSIKALAGELSIPVKEVNIGVAGASVIVRLISMPRMTDDELAGAVRFEAEKFIPFDVNDCVLDFQIISKGEKGKNDVDILLAAVKKDYVMQKLKIVEEAGFSVNTVDVDILAATNAFLGNFPSQDPSRTLALLDVGASCTDVSILKAGSPSFLRQVSIGSGECSAAISKKLGLGSDAAEALKVSPQDRLTEVISCTKPVLSNLIDEIKLSFGYYENQSGRSIDEVYIAGGGAAIAGLEDAFQEILGSKPRYWDPFDFLDKSSLPQGVKMDEKTRSTFGVAVGLALR